MLAIKPVVDCVFAVFGIFVRVPYVITPAGLSWALSAGILVIFGVICAAVCCTAAVDGMPFDPGPFFGAAPGVNANVHRPFEYAFNVYELPLIELYAVYACEAT